MSVLSIVEWVIWGIVLAYGLLFAIGIRLTAVHRTAPPTWPTLILSLSLVAFPIAFLFLPLSKLHILWMLFILWQFSGMASFIYIPIVSQLLIWPAYVYASILMMGTGLCLTSPSERSPWAARLPKQWPWLTRGIRKTLQDSTTNERKNSTEKDNANFLYEKLWRDSLCEIVPQITAKEIATELLIPDKIDGFAFADNYTKFLRKGMPSFEKAIFPNEVQEHSTSSITEASSPSKHTPLFPDWFIAAYPDVFLWFDNVQYEHLKNRKADEDWDKVMGTLNCDLFGINMEDKELQIDNILDSNEKCLPKWLKKLVSSYKRKTGKKPETSVDETKNNAIREIYENIDIAKSMSESGLDNFTIIARKTTMYYLELSGNYRQRFRNEAGLLAAAGVLDAHVYIFMNKTIECSDIVELAEKVVADKNELLTEFIVRLEVKMLAVDSPEFSREMVENCCQEEKPRIHKEIQRVQKEYKCDPFITKEVQAFMESPNFSEMRDQLGVR